jgi:hypothetical protein
MRVGKQIITSGGIGRTNRWKASGGSVLLNQLGAVEGALIRAAASTQTFDAFPFPSDD